MTPGVPAAARYTAARYLALADEGVLGPDDRIELLEGVIVAMSPHNPAHASGVRPFPRFSIGSSRTGRS